MMNHDVFISYSTKNKSTADAICHTLESHQIKCWIAPRDLLAGEKYGSIIEQAINHCKVCVFIFSKDSRNSVWCESELNNAFSGRKTIIPFKIDSSELDGELKLMLNNRHWIDAFPNPESSFAQLVISVQMALGAAVTVTQPEPKKSGKGNKVGFIVGGVAVALAAVAFLYFSTHQESSVVESQSEPAVAVVEEVTKPAPTSAPKSTPASEPAKTVVAEKSVAEPTPTPAPAPAPTPAPATIAAEAAPVAVQPVAEPQPQPVANTEPTPKVVAPNPEAEKLFAEGQAVEKSGDMLKAINVYKRAVQKNSLEACIRLVEIYTNGAGNISPNRMQAEMWQKKADKLK